MAKKGSVKDESHKNLNELEVSADPEYARGVYSNLARVTFTENEFILGFVLNIETEAHLVSRVIVSPQHMKDLSRAIQKSLTEYEEAYKK